MEALFILSFRDEFRKNISTNDKKVGREGVSLSEPPFWRERLGRLAIYKDGESDIGNTIHDSVSEVLGEPHASRVD
jgi:hypothetical protein